jgi:hypothetical protein
MLRSSYVLLFPRIFFIVKRFPRFRAPLQVIPISLQNMA